MAVPEDWRLQLLQEEGIPADDLSLSGLLNAGNPTEKLFLERVPQLGAEDFVTREQAAKDLKRMGKAALPWIDRMPVSGDPEIRFRLASISKELGLGREWTKSELLHYAAASLLAERKNPSSPKPGGLIFGELFHDESNSLEDGYRDFTFKAGKGYEAKVTGGVLLMNGKFAVEGDQRLVFDAQKITGKADFPDEFQLEVMLGGGSGGAGLYHVGVSVGNVRALFHPGYQGGGFRFERIDTHQPITQNVTMGFVPLADKLQLMSIGVKRLAHGEVELNVAVSAPGAADRFIKTTKVAPEVIGKLDSISLDRSGNRGGDGMFDNLVIRMSGK